MLLSGNISQTLRVLDDGGSFQYFLSVTLFTFKERRLMERFFVFLILAVRCLMC